jgi:hypothetical protein
MLISAKYGFLVDDDQGNIKRTPLHRHRIHYYRHQELHTCLRVRRVRTAQSIQQNQALLSTPSVVHPTICSTTASNNT